MVRVKVRIDDVADLARSESVRIAARIFGDKAANCVSTKQNPVFADLYGHVSAVAPTSM